MSENATSGFSSPVAPTPTSPDPNGSAVLVVTALTQWAKESEMAGGACIPGCEHQA
jgi:hypothetical protein